MSEDSASSAGHKTRNPFDFKKKKKIDTNSDSKSRSGHKTRNPFDFKKKKSKQNTSDEDSDTRGGKPGTDDSPIIGTTATSQIEEKSAKLKKRNPFETKGTRGDGTLATATSLSLNNVDDGTNDVSRFRSQAVPYLGQDAFANTTADTLVGSKDKKSPESRKNKRLRIDAIKEIASQLTEYEIISHIDEGGMGIVFKAMQRRLKRLVAIKLLKTGKFTVESRKQRFLFEAEACAALKHPHIVQIIEVGEVSGNPYYVMDYVNGLPLDDYVAKNDLSPKKITRVIAQVAEAVHHFHSRGILHRDLKPDNILIDENGEPKIIDFGVAKEMATNKDSMTRDGAIIGTPHYMSPEQAFGKVLELDIRADVYALGAILYRLLTGQTPYSSGTLSLILAIQTTDPTPIRSVVSTLPWELAAIVTKAMEREVDLRYPTALALKEDLSRFLNHEPVLAKRASHLYRIQKYVRRNKTAVLVGALLFFVVSSSIAVAIDQRLTAIEKVAESNKKEAALAKDAKEKEEEANKALKRELIAKTESAAKDRSLRLESEKNERLTREKAAQERSFAAEREKRAIEKRRLEVENAKKLKAAQETAEKRQLENLRREALALLGLPRDDLLASVNNLSKALNLVGDKLPKLQLEIESAKMVIVLKLAKNQVSAGETKLASFWLDQGRDLERALAIDKFSTEINGVATKIEELRRGLTIVAEAKRAVSKKDWPTALVLLRQARQAGALEKDLAGIQEQVDQGCQRSYEELFAEARRLNNEKSYSTAFDKCSQALPFAKDPVLIVAFRNQVALNLARQAQIESNRLSLIPESAPRAPQVIQDCAKRLAGTPYEASLRLEYSQRLSLLTNNRLTDFHYIPAVPELKTSAAYMQSVEVSQAAFRRFVDALGYDNDEYWDKSCSKLLRENWKSLRNGQQLNKDEGDYPVRGLSWYEARAFAKWMSKELQLTVRIPTTKEWLAANWDLEKQTLRSYPWGDRFKDGQIVFEQSGPLQSKSNKRDRSPFGIYDLAGNVAEWTTDFVKGREVPAIKGADFFGDELHTKKFAQVRSAAYPEAVPVNAVRNRIGLRLVVEP
ncbi:MAG: protein kinase [Planctomycetota bacterium]|nr:protein kinase [Planctomycetota bacterium]